MDDYKLMNSYQPSKSITRYNQGHQSKKDEMGGM